MSAEWTPEIWQQYLLTLILGKIDALAGHYAGGRYFACRSALRLCARVMICLGDAFADLHGLWCGGGRAVRQSDWRLSTALTCLSRDSSRVMSDDATQDTALRANHGVNIDPFLCSGLELEHHILLETLDLSEQGAEFQLFAGGALAKPWLAVASPP